VVKTAGDGAMLAFHGPTHGLRFAREFQATLRGHARLSEIRVRVAMHCGPAIRHHDDYYGTTVTLVARVASAARGGEGLVSEAVHDAVAADDAFGFDEPFAVTLKGFDTPHVVRALR
jgi:class 3 adenylate cyclase